MNWQEIKEKYPKAFVLMHNFQHKELAYKEPYPPIVLKDLSRFQENYGIRFLYDFFDGEGIWISIMRNHYYEDNMDNSLHEFFDWSITVDSEYVADGEVEELTRTEAEEQAFLKAFEILENKLGAVK